MTPKGKLMPATVKVDRTAQFWQLTTPKGDLLGGLFPTSEVLKAISALSSTKIYVDLFDETRLLAIVQKTKVGDPRHVTLYRVRHKNIPAMEQGGVIRDLPISSTQNVAE